MKDCLAFRHSSLKEVASLTFCNFRGIYLNHFHVSSCFFKNYMLSSMYIDCIIVMGTDRCAVQSSCKFAK